MDLKKLTEEVMTTLMAGDTVTQVDGADQEPTIESDTKTTFTMYKHHDVKTGPSRGQIMPLGIWEVKVTLEATYKKFDEEG